jgi:hypothetical protein
MLETVFGQNIPPAAKFLIAFVVVLALIALTAWLVRRFASDRFGASTARGRQPRLAVIDAAAVDSRRRLVLVRRDNVEHLLMIGGPSDIVVEPNIMRVPNAMREPGRVPMQPEAARAVAPNDGSMWPLQPQNDTPAVMPEVTSRPARAPNLDALLPRTQAEPPVMTPPLRRRAETPPPMLPPEERMARPADAKVPPLRPMRMATPTVNRTEPALTAPPVNAPQPPARAIPRQPSPPLATGFDSGSSDGDQDSRKNAEPSQAEQNRADQSLAEMAQKLELALRPTPPAPASTESKPASAKPTASAVEAVKSAAPSPVSPQPFGPAVSGPPPAPKPEVSKPDAAKSDSAKSAPPMRGPDTSLTNQPIAPEPHRAPAVPPMAEPASEKSKDKAPNESLYDSLEKEMASLLGRPPGKT